MLVPADHARVIKAALAEVERTHRAHGRAVATLHRHLARAAREHGATMGLEDALIAEAAAPKNPPPND